MRKRIIAALVAAVTAATVALTGCGSTVNDDRSSVEYADVHTDVYTTFYYQPENGHITRVITEPGTTYEELWYDHNYTETDVELTVPGNMVMEAYSYGVRGNMPSRQMETSVDIDGTSYPVTFSFTGTNLELSYDQLVETYNTFATLESSAQLGEVTVIELVYQEFWNRFDESYQNGQIPEPQAAITNQVITVSPVIAAGWRAGDPAWVTQQAINLSQNASTTPYEYSFLCSTHTVKVTNRAEFDAAAEELLPGVSLRTHLDTPTITAPTTEPCEIIDLTENDRYMPGPPPPPEPHAPPPWNPAP